MGLRFHLTASFQECQLDAKGINPVNFASPIPWGFAICVSVAPWFLYCWWFPELPFPTTWNGAFKGPVNNGNFNKPSPLSRWVCRVLSLPRWSHDAINSQMVFGSGRAGDTSIYSMVRPPKVINRLFRNPQVDVFPKNTCQFMSDFLWGNVFMSGIQCRSTNFGATFFFFGVFRRPRGKVHRVAISWGYFLGLENALVSTSLRYMTSGVVDWIYPEFLHWSLWWKARSSWCGRNF